MKTVNEVRLTTPFDKTTRQFVAYRQLSRNINLYNASNFLLDNLSVYAFYT